MYRLWKACHLDPRVAPPAQAAVALPEGRIQAGFRPRTTATRGTVRPRRVEVPYADGRNLGLDWVNVSDTQPRDDKGVLGGLMGGYETPGLQRSRGIRDSEALYPLPPKGLRPNNLSTTKGTRHGHPGRAIALGVMARGGRMDDGRWWTPTPTWRATSQPLRGPSTPLQDTSTTRSRCVTFTSKAT
jgi:hypothetical protein